MVVLMISRERGISYQLRCLETYAFTNNHKTLLSSDAKQYTVEIKKKKTNQIRCVILNEVQNEALMYFVGNVAKMEHVKRPFQSPVFYIFACHILTISWQVAGGCEL